MPDRPDDRLYDKRLVKRFLESGALSEKDLEKRVKALPDLEDQSEVCNVVVESVGEND